MDPQTAANLEAIRARAMGGPPSGAGIPGGAPAINTPSPLNPVANAGVSSPPGLSSPVPQGVSGNSPFTSPMSAMQKAQPDEATIIVKGLLARLGDLPSNGQPVGIPPMPTPMGGLNG